MVVNFVIAFFRKLKVLLYSFLISSQVCSKESCCLVPDNWVLVNRMWYFHVNRGLLVGKRAGISFLQFQAKDSYIFMGPYLVCYTQ